MDKRISSQSVFKELKLSIIEEAKRGHPPSQLMLGRMYLYGLFGIKKDLKKARIWIRLVADAQYEEAQSLLEKMKND